MFTQEFESSIANIKFLALNFRQFHYPRRAFAVTMCQVIIIFLIEILNIYNLLMYTDVLDIIMNYIVLGCIGEFDDQFLSMF